MKGVTIPIGADTKQFEKGIKKIDGQIRGTNNIVNSLNKSLELDFDDAKFSGALNQAQKVIEFTEQKAQALRDELKFLENSGQVDSAAYQKFQNQLIRTEADAVLLKNKLEEINKLKFDRISDQVKNIGEGITKAGNALKPFSIAATGLLATFVAIGKSSISTASQIMDFSEQVNINAETLQKWQYVAMQSGLKNEDLQNAFIKTQSALSDLATGAGGKGAEALSMLNLSTDQATKGMEANLDIILERLNSIEDPILKAAMANDIFGDRLGAKLIPLLTKGGEGLATLYAEFEALGYMTNEQAQSLADFDDVLNQIKLSLSNVKNQMGAALLPIMQLFASFIQEKIVPAVQKVSEWFINLSESQQKFLFGSLALVAGLAPVLLIMGKITSGIGGLISSTGGLTKALSLLSAHPIIAIIGAIAALLGVMYAKNEDFRNSVNELVSTLGGALAPLLQTLVKSFANIFKALMPIVDLIANILTPIINFITPIITKIVDIIVKKMVPNIEFATKVISGLFNFINELWAGVLKGVESFVNGIIRGINTVINAVSQVDKFFGGDGIKQIKEVNFTAGLNAPKQSTTTTTSKAPEAIVTPEQVITNTAQNYNYPQTITTNNDYSQKEIKIEVTVQNFAQEVDVDKMVRDINLKLAEQF